MSEQTYRCVRFPSVSEFSLHRFQRRGLMVGETPNINRIGNESAVTFMDE